jgi:hypothetical protein
MVRIFFTLFIVMIAVDSLYSEPIQSADTSATGQSPLVDKLSDKTLKGLDKKYSSLQQSVDQQSMKLLNRMKKQEIRLGKEMQQKDSIKAKQLFSDATLRYEELKTKLSSPVTGLVPRPLQEYVPRLDSLQTVMHFLGQPGAGISAISGGKLQQVQILGQHLQQLEGKMQQAGEIQDFIRQREEQLKDQLTQYGMGKQLLGINKEVYYYQQRLSDYKAILNDQEKLESTAMDLVRQLPAFQQFIQQNSYLAQLFPRPANYGTAQALAGLQTSASVGSMISQQAATMSSGTNPQAYLQQQAQAAQDQLNQLKDKVEKLGGGSSNMEMPQFQPDGQKTKRFLQRLEYGFNIQSQQSTNFLPVTTDAALSVGYRISDKATLGMGLAYKIGWGRGWNKISLSNQGIGLRSYIDIRAKGSIWITGGFEYNYQQEFEKWSQISNLDVWQKSALIGVTKKYKIGKRTANMQLLYDLLATYQLPRAQAFKFRIGYSF